MTPITRLGLVAAFSLAAATLSLPLIVLSCHGGLLPAVALATVSGFGLVLLLPDR